jgi:hypothetical protein
MKTSVIIAFMLILPIRKLVNKQVKDKRFTNYKQVFAEPPSCDEFLLEFYYRSSSIALIIIELGIVNIISSRPMFYLCLFPLF